MRTLIIIAVLAAAGYYGFQAVTAKSEAFVAFEKYKEWERNGNCGEMRNLVEADSQAEASVGQLCAKVGGMSAAGLIADMNSTPGSAMRTFVFKVEKETTAAGGNEVVMTIKESVRGRNSAMNPLPPPRTYTVRAKKTGKVWKLVELPN